MGPDEYMGLSLACVALLILWLGFPVYRIDRELRATRAAYERHVAEALAVVDADTVFDQTLAAMPEYDADCVRWHLAIAGEDER